MKLKTTKKQIRENTNGNLYSIGYCELDYLLKYKDPFAYSAGYYGWTCDYYNINGVIISTGYNPIGISIDYNLAKEFNKKAKNLHAESELNNLINEFIEVINNK